MVHAARLIRNVEVILDDIVINMSTNTNSSTTMRDNKEGDGWDFDDDNNDDDDNDRDNNSNDEHGSIHNDDDDVSKMLNEMRQRSRRYRMELRYRANTMIEQCIIIDTNLQLPLESYRHAAAAAVAAANPKKGGGGERQQQQLNQQLQSSCNVYVNTGNSNNILVLLADAYVDTFGETEETDATINRLTPHCKMLKYRYVISPVNRKIPI
jgi:hypothetical protein